MEGSTRLFELLADALALPLAERAAFLSAACEGDAALLTEAQSLLGHETGAREFLEEPAFRLDPETLPEPTTGELAACTLLGEYEIVRLLGQGGMGEVYLARDTKLGRPVAVKLLKRSLDETGLLRRFQHEQTVLAALTHPNIARLYSGATTPGKRCYLVMEYVEGEPLDRYCETRNLGVLDRLALFRKVCAAVSYAHQNLVIHRDLKPANIRVTPDGEPKLLDFGIAKLLDPDGTDPAGESAVTAPGAMTPGYASPEQLMGEVITTSTDVYSLGVVLYELLCGQRPYHLKSRQPGSMARAIREQPPEKPSTVAARTPGTVAAGGRAAPLASVRRQLSGDLDSIVAAAMHVEPQRRYASVAQLSEDLRRRGEGLPVSARRNTLPYVARKFILRHKAWVTVASLAIIGLVVALAAILWEARRANRRFDDVRHLANSILFEVEPQIANVSGTTAARSTLVQRALEYLDSLSREAGADHALHRELAAAYEKVGDVQGNPNVSNLGDIKAAVVSYRKAHGLRQELVRSAPRDAQGRHELANNDEQIGSMLWWSDDTSGAKASYAEALALRKTLLAEQPRSVDFRRGFASLQMRLADVDTWGGQTLQAMDDLNSALPILQELARELPTDTAAQINVARCLLRMGAANKEAGNFAGAVTAFEQAQGIVEPITRREPDNAVAGLQYCIELMSECETYNVQNTTASTNNALALAPRMIRVVEAFAAKDPRNTGIQHNLACGYYSYGETLLHAGQWQQALDPLQKGLLIDTNLGAQAPENGEYKHSCGYFNLDLGAARLGLGEVDAAADHAQKAEESLKAAIAKDPDNTQPQRELVNAWMLEGKICQRRQQPAEARRYFEQALADLEALHAKKVTTPGDSEDGMFLRGVLATQ